MHSSSNAAGSSSPFSFVFSSKSWAFGGGRAFVRLSSPKTKKNNVFLKNRQIEVSYEFSREFLSVFEALKKIRQIEAWTIFHVFFRFCEPWKFSSNWSVNKYSRFFCEIGNVELFYIIDYR